MKARLHCLICNEETIFIQMPRWKFKVSKTIRFWYELKTLWHCDSCGYYRRIDDRELDSEVILHETE